MRRWWSWIFKTIHSNFPEEGIFGIVKNMRRIWTQEHDYKLEKVASIEELRDFALNVLNAIEGEVGMVTGPIGSGGLGSREKNLERFKQVVDQKYEEGQVLFDQMPLQTKIKEFFDKSGGDKMLILDGLYLPLFKTGKIKKFFFMPGWESSMGAQWEHEKAKELGIEINYLE